MWGPDGLIGHVTLVHSPLVGPSVWVPFTRLLERRGVTVSCPDLRDAVTADRANRMQRFVETAAAAATGDEVVLVGFSGAGALLPNIADESGLRLRCSARCVVRLADRAIRRHTPEHRHRSGGRGRCDRATPRLSRCPRRLTVLQVTASRERPSLTS